jgi:hypothetical protein
MMAGGGDLIEPFIDYHGREHQILTTIVSRIYLTSWREFDFKLARRMLGAVGKSCSRRGLVDRRVVSVWATSSNIDRRCCRVLASVGSSYGSFPAHSFSSWTKLESATGRARKRRRRITQLQRQERIADSPRGKKQADQVMVEPERLYPKNKPWLVLFPNPYLDQEGVDQGPPKPKKPLLEMFRDLGKAWNLYLTTWEGTILRAPKKETSILQQEIAGPEGPSQGDEIRSNVARNLEVARREGTDLIEQAKEQTGIRNQEDLKAFASDMMRLATECLKEFMAGYREGRDNEVDKMLHDYFQEQEQGESQSSGDKEEEDSKPKRRRKPKQRILRDF